MSNTTQEYNDTKGAGYNMIPLRLEIKNFLSYGPTTQIIDFKDYPLICLAGKNGHGKSALLDAMTWALWGAARKTFGAAKADEGLLRLGQTQMLVSLSFLFNGHYYRVRREFAKGQGKNYAVLDIELFNQETQSYITLTDKTIRLTQTKIDQLIGLDYETFVNSAFLRQGLSNEFSQKSPKERKQILANILGLQRYDQLKTRALEKSRALDEERRLLLNVAELAQTELAQEAQLALEQDNCRRVQTELEAKNVQVRIKQQQLNEKKQSIDRALQIMHAFREQLKQEQSHESRELNLFRELNQSWRKVHYAQCDAPPFAQLEAERAQLVAQDRAFMQLQTDSLALQEKLLVHKSAYQNKHNELSAKAQAEQYQERLLLEKDRSAVEQLRLSIEKKEQEMLLVTQKLQIVTQRHSAVEKELRALPELESCYEKEYAQFAKRKEYYATLQQRGNWTTQLLRELEQKIAATREVHDPTCPLCEQVLTLKRKQFLNHKFVKEESTLSLRKDRVAYILVRLKAILVEQHARLQTIQEQRTVLQKLVGEEKTLNGNILELTATMAMLKDTRTNDSEQHKHLTSMLTIRETAIEQHTLKVTLSIAENAELKRIAATMHGIEEEMRMLGYDKAVHEEEQKKLKELEMNIAALAGLKDELARQDERIRLLRQKKDNVRVHRAKIAQITREMSVHELVSAQESIVRDEERMITEEIDALNHAQSQVTHTLGSLQRAHERIALLKTEAIVRNERMKIIDHELNDFHTLSTMFGKDGLQSLLIEEAIPEIEAEANNLLSRLTDNRSQVFIESLRDLKKGGAKETLDIQISDSSGIRPYEMFSGGEAFRIDFALRIAISKLLARRAGTSLQTLIIDEGFGSQDDEGLSRLMDMIYAIGSDFARVIVVSHLPLFKENFPVHFVVEKRAYGSQVTVIERG